MLLLVVCGSFLCQPATMAAVFSQGFPAAAEVSVGMLVSLNASGLVEPATPGNSNNLLGVVVEPSGAAMAITSNNEQEVQVTTSGQAAVLVSDINGTIKKGDQITTSSLEGIGMKATSEANQKIIGIAQTDAGPPTPQRISANGGSREVKISRVPAMVSVSSYTPQSGPITYLQQAGTVVAGRPVSSVKAILAALVLLVAILSVSVLLYTGIRSGITSIGRNPLSESAVRHELMRVLLVAPLILGAALILIYAILKG